jgi:hypothetical protein
MPRENMTEAMARELLRVAQHYGGWTPDDPDRTPENTDLDLAFQEANQLYDVVLDSYKSGVRSPAILDMLFAGMVEPVADHPEVYDGNRESIFESERRALSDLEPVAPAPPQEKPAQGTAHENTNLGSAFDPVTQSISGDASQPAALPHPLEQIFPGYDGFDSNQIIAEVFKAKDSGELLPEEWDAIKAYERDHQNRAEILEYEPWQEPEDVTAGADSTPAPRPDTFEPALEQPQPATTAATQGSFEIVGNGESTGPIPHDQYPGDTTEPDLSATYQSGGQHSLLHAKLNANFEPIDVTGLAPEELATRIFAHSADQSLLYTTLSREEGKEDAAAYQAKEAWNEVYAREYEERKQGLEKPTEAAYERARSEAKHAADMAEEVLLWRRRETRHRIEARNLKHLADQHKTWADRLGDEQRRRMSEARTAVAR